MGGDDAREDISVKDRQELFSYHLVYYSVSLWPTLLFSNLSISSRKITVSHQPFSVLTDFNNFYLPSTFTHNFYPQYFHRFPQIFSDLHRFILPSSLYFLAIFYLAPSLQDLHQSSTDLSKIFQNFPSSIPFY